MFEIIKRKRQFDSSHWRYQILHWFYRVDKEQLDENGQNHKVPSFFYSKYCPLFHATNLMLIGLPLLLLWRAVGCVARVVAYAAKEVFDAVETWNTQRQKAKFDALPEAVKQAYYLRVATKAVKKFLKRYNEYYRSKGGDFETFYRHYQFDLPENIEFTKEQYEALFLELESKKKVQEDETVIQHRNQAVFWVNFSSKFFRIGINLSYVAVGLLVSYYIVADVIPFAIWCAIWLWNAITEVSLVEVGSGTLKFVACCAALFFLYQFLVIYEGFKSVVKPFVIVWSCLKSSCSYTNKLADNCRDFFAMFYENNCPPIEYTKNGVGDDEC